MNDLVELRGQFNSMSPIGNNFGSPTIPNGSRVTLGDLDYFFKEMKAVHEFWIEEEYLDFALISVRYRQIIAKSNRMGQLLKDPSIDLNQSVVGAAYSEYKSKPCHLITYRFSMTGILNSLSDIEVSIKIMEDYFGKGITKEEMANINQYNIDFDSYSGMSKTKFLQIIKDAYYVVDFEIPTSDLEDESQIVTFYNVGADIRVILKNMNIHVLGNRELDENTFLMDEIQIRTLKNNAPYLVSMAVKDFSSYNLEDIIENSDGIRDIIDIPSPSNEPIIGVIDTLFDSKVYFSDWVEYHDTLDRNIERTPRAYDHGTAVSSIIVDGPSFNPDLYDGCGRFRVRHFGVAGDGLTSSFTIVKKIERIIIENPDIKVWNFCLGSQMEINEHSISPEGYVLDRLQKEHDILFIVSGTNDEQNTGKKRIGSPADSLNALVVNAVNRDGDSASYTRTGPVLSFFNKPDVSYYGGDKDWLMKVCKPTGAGFVCGTSYAAPWITRKAAYLIHVMGFSREITKAILIDSAIPWEDDLGDISKKGYGIVPIRIEDVIQGEEDEIKFYLTGQSNRHKTFNYKIPVPIAKEKYPYISRATMVYFPDCTRYQGIDYTDAELNIKFGRLHDNGQINAVNNDKQFIPENYTHEEEARDKYRKWDNVKHIREMYTPRKQGKKTYQNKNWGLEIIQSSRLTSTLTEVDFGVVVTLKELNGINRLDSFIQKCEWQGWIVNRVNIDQQVEIYNVAQEEIEFDL